MEDRLEVLHSLLVVDFKYHRWVTELRNAGVAIGHHRIVDLGPTILQLVGFDKGTDQDSDDADQAMEILVSVRAKLEDSDMKMEASQFIAELTRHNLFGPKIKNAI